ncbi:MAG: hypothetical protein MZV63_19665, partial [Marinilabiliales bacterium]|nr:hypothetical protein [Marinilabiliales bacterium]
MPPQADLDVAAARRRSDPRLERRGARAEVHRLHLDGIPTADAAADVHPAFAAPLRLDPHLPGDGLGFDHRVGVEIGDGRR